MGEKRSSKRRYVIRYAGELSAREVIVRLLKLAAEESGTVNAAAPDNGRCHGTDETCENGQGSSICQDKQG